MHNLQERNGIAKRKPRVAYLTNMLLDWETREPRYGGGEFYCLTLGRLLRDLNFEVTFFQAGRTAFEGDYYGFRVIALPQGEYVSEFQTGICNLFYNITQSYDHVIHNIPTYASGLLRDDALILCHSVWFDHNNSKPPIEFRTPEWFEELYRSLSRPELIVCVDTNIINVTRALWPEIAARMTYIPNYVDTAVFSPPQQRDNHRLTVLFPRRSEYTRGSQLLEPILKRVPHDCRVLWVGEGEPEETERIKRLAESDGRLQFFAAPFEEMPEFYKQADICVIPAVASEGTCLASLEALASGCAVVCTNVGGLANIFQPGVNCLMTNVDAEQLADAINRLIEDPDERMRLQQAGPETAAHFSLDVWRRRWTQLLTSIGWIDGAVVNGGDAPAVDAFPCAEQSPSGQTSVASLIDELSDHRQIIARLVAELSQAERQVKALFAEAGIPGPDHKSLAHSLQELKTRIEKLAAGSNLIAERDEEISSLSSELKALREQIVLASDLNILLKERLEDKDRLIQALEEVARARGKEVLSLKDELTLWQNKARQITSLNQFLKEQIADREGVRQMLLAQVRAVEEELNRIKSSLGWRLLSRYGKIKYRYLLPAYRRLSPSRVAPPNPLPSPPPAAPLLDAKLDQLLRETQPLPPLGSADQEIAPTRKADFYESLTLLPHLPEQQSEMILNQQPPPATRRLPDVVCFGIIDWEFRYQRPQQIMSQFAAHGHRVFYVSPSRFLDSGATPRVMVSKIKENIYEVQLAALRQPDIYGEVIAGEARESLLESLAELRRMFNIDEAIGYTMIASWGELALRSQHLWGWRIIYDCMDEWESFPGIKPPVLSMEKRLVQECDLLVVTARRLLEKWQPFGRPTVLARNGVDYEFYDAHCHPNNILTDVKHPVAGYYGAIADWFDLQLMTDIARRRPDYTFVLLGGVFDVDVSALHALPNVRLLGQQPYELMPQYLYHFDACIIPFKVNPITEATDPVKVYEYLSGGKPVVSVALQELDYSRNHVRLAEGTEDFLDKLDEAVADDDPAAASRRRQFARQQTWESRYEAIHDGLASVTPRASIVVVTYNNLVLNKLCLESLIRNTEYPNYELIVVDNASQDGTPVYLRYLASRYSNIKVIQNNENRGFAAANNQGLACAKGDYFVLLNNDTVVPPGWLSRLLRHLRHFEVGMVGPVTNFVGNEAKIAVPYTTWGEMEEFARIYTWEHDGLVADIHMLAMFCVAFRRDTFEVIGPLDEQFGIGMFEDDDYSQRMRSHGYRVICAADVFVHHFGQAAFKKLIETGDYNPLFEENRGRYESKWNCKWVPHEHMSLRFQPLQSSISTVQEARGEGTTTRMEKQHSRPSITESRPRRI